MNDTLDEFRTTKRFFVPNEDARVVALALEALDRRVLSPAFVGGSGMLMLQAATCLPGGVEPFFVDVSLAQARMFVRLQYALEAARTPEDLRAWFAQAVYPDLRAYYAGRGQDYPLQNVFDALKNIFGIGLFFDPEDFAKARRVARHALPRVSEVGSYLSGRERAHDFIHLSNVADYLPAPALAGLFASCAAHPGPVYLLLTAACPEPAAVRLAWEQNGYREHPAGTDLTEANQGLGSPGLARPWNRPGTIHLLCRGN
jgi:hypothetical protein